MSRNDQMIREWQLMRLLESPNGKTLQALSTVLPNAVPIHERTGRMVL